MKTVITIVFDKRVNKRKLQDLVSDIDAQCSEDSDGNSYTSGSYQIILTEKEDEE